MLKSLLQFTSLPVAAGVLLGACSLFGNDPAPLTTGVYALAFYNGQRLPFDTGPLPTKGANPSGCHVLITAGRISIQSAARTFLYNYDIRNGCTNELMSQSGLQGTYEVAGSELTFIIQRADGEVFRHSGRLTSSRIVFISEGEMLEFHR